MLTSDPDATLVTTVQDCRHEVCDDLAVDRFSPCRKAVQ